jgi:hypothetical protein
MTEKVVSLGQKLTEAKSAERDMHLREAARCDHELQRIAEVYSGQISMNALFDDIRHTNGEG